MRFFSRERSLETRDEESISDEVVSPLSHERKGERLEYKQQRELWDWNTMKSAGVFGLVWEQALGERRGKDTGASVRFFFCSIH